MSKSQTANPIQVLHSYLLVHEHKYGATTVQFNANTSKIESLHDNVHGICEQLGVDFEPEKLEESVTFLELGGEVKTIIL